MTGWTAKQAGEEIKKKILTVAGYLLNLPPDDLWMENGIIWSKSRPKAERLTFEEVAKKYFINSGPLIGTGVYSPPRLGGMHKGAPVGTSPCYSFCFQATEVEVDEETGVLNVTQAWDVHDAGQVINPALMEGQVHGAFSMALSESLYEQVLFNDKGKIINPDLANYRQVTAKDMIKFTNRLITSNDEPAAPWGAKEVGEGANNPTMGAIRNAIFDAIGVDVNSLPITSEKVWRAIKEKKAKG